MAELYKSARISCMLSSGVDEKRQYLDSNETLTSLVFNYGDATIERIKEFNRMRSVSKSMNEMVKSNMEPTCDIATCPVWMKTFHAEKLKGNCEYFDACLLPTQIEDESDDDYSKRRSILVDEVLKTMNAVYIYETSLVIMLKCLQKVIDSTEYCSYLTGNLQRVGFNFRESIATWMGPHRKNRIIQILGCRLIVSFPDFVIESLVLNRLTIILEDYPKDCVVVFNALSVLKDNSVKLKNDTTNEFDVKPLIKMNRTISKIVEIYEDCKDSDFMSLDDVDRVSNTIQNTRRRILKSSCTFLESSWSRLNRYYVHH